MAKPNWLNDLCSEHGLSIAHADLSRMWGTFRNRADATHLFQVNDDPVIQQAFLTFILTESLGTTLPATQVKRAVHSAMPRMIKQFRDEDAKARRQWEERRAKEEEKRLYIQKQKAANLRCNADYCWSGDLGEDTLIEDGRIYHRTCAPTFLEKERRRRELEQERRLGVRGLSDARQRAREMEAKLELRRAELAGMRNAKDL